MRMIKDLMKNNITLVFILAFPWVITELLEIGIYLIKPQEEFKPSIERSFCFLK